MTFICLVQVSVLNAKYVSLLLSFKVYEYHRLSMKLDCFMYKSTPFFFKLMHKHIAQDTLFATTKFNCHTTTVINKHIKYHVLHAKQAK